MQWEQYTDVLVLSDTMNAFIVIHLHFHFSHNYVAFNKILIILQIVIRHGEIAGVKQQHLLCLQFM